MSTDVVKVVWNTDCELLNLKLFHHQLHVTDNNVSLRSNFLRLFKQNEDTGLTECEMNVQCGAAHEMSHKLADYIYDVSEKNPACVFLTYSQTVRKFNQFLHICYSFFLH